jgi:16S rRNA (guanine1516-N2)-methyltransferase
MVNHADIAVKADSDDPAVTRAAQELAARLGLKLESDAKTQATFVLGVHEDGLELREAASRPRNGLAVDFSELNPRRAAARGGFSRRQPLARAIGKTAKTVLDATAGLGHDAALLACMGYQVIAVERSPILAELLRDGLRRAMDDPQLSRWLGGVGRLEIISGDARAVLREANHEYDVVYIDPMFPPKRKASALAKKEIRMVRQLVGDDEDAADLLDIARRVVRRVVVKRPSYAPPLAKNPTASIEGKLVRYDIYVRA